MPILSKIRNLGFDVALCGDNLKVTPASSLTMQQREFFKTHKAEIIAELEAANERVIVVCHTPRGGRIEVEALISKVDYHHFDNTTLIVCAMTLKNGFITTGISACSSPENFDTELGKKIAYENAKNKIYAFEAYSIGQRVFL